MPKKNRDEFAPRDKKEPYKWKCDKCSAKGTAATKVDAQLVKELHVAMVHD